MKNTIICLIFLLMIIPILSPQTSAYHVENQVNETNVKTSSIILAFSFQTPTITKDEQGFDSVMINGLESYGVPGAPILPVESFQILIPPDNTLEKYTVSTGTPIPLPGSYLVSPGQTPIPVDSLDSVYNTPPNNTIYSSNTTFPLVTCTQKGIQSFRGYSIGLFVLYPVQYIPACRQLKYFDQITVEITFIPNHEKKGLSQSYRGLVQDEQRVQEKVMNPRDVQWYRESNPIMNDEPGYDLLLITNESLQSGFQRLITDHEQRGIRTQVKLFGVDIQIGDTYEQSCINIRNFIRQEYEEQGIQYVLIGGDIDIIPAAYLFYDHIPSDLYYTCLDGSFNSDGDAIWGEPTDGGDIPGGDGDVDLVSEIYIGRASVGNLTEVGNFVNKTLTYLTTSISDEYLSRIIMLGEYLGGNNWAGDSLDQMINGSNSNQYTTVGIPDTLYSLYQIERIYDRDWQQHGWPQPRHIHDGGWSRFVIIDRINSGVHIINHFGHSGDFYNMKLDIYWNSSDIDQITNDEYCFIYSQGCDAGSFDTDAAPWRPDCIAEYFTVKMSHGAFAGIWNTRSGWIGPSNYFHRQFWDAVFGEGITLISQANQDSKEDNRWMIDSYNHRFCYYELMYFGDPTLEFKLLNPKRNVAIPNLVVSEHVQLGPELPLDVGVVNTGVINETNVVVQFLVDGMIQSTQVIPFLEHHTLYNLSFIWHVPHVGVFNVSFYIFIRGVREEIIWDNDIFRRVIVGVYNQNTTECFIKIQDAINDPDTMDNHKLLIPSGVYPESIIVTKNIELHGKNPKTTFITGRTPSFTPAPAISIKKTGVTVLNTHGVNLTGVTIKNCSTGVFIRSAVNTRIEGLNISTVNGIGVYLSSAVNTVLTNTDIIKNNVGASIDSHSENNKIYHNYFNNSQNAVDYSSSTSWDDGYYLDDMIHISGGNYWSDYQGSDELRGPNQNLSYGSDGIGDTAYRISNSRYDHYPLMTHYHGTLPGIYYVDIHNSAGPWNGTLEHPYQSVQQALDNVSMNGDTVYVFPGTYAEDVRIMHPYIRLIGQNQQTTLITGNIYNSIVTIYNNINGVTITGFTFEYDGQAWDGTGIQVFSNNNTITKNIFTRNRESAIRLWKSKNTTITENTIQNNDNGGIIIDQSQQILIRNNTFISNGIRIQGNEIEDWNTHIIENNTVNNNKAILYYKNIVGFSVPSNAGQVILANCSEMILDGLTILGVDNGVQLGFSNHNIIKNSDIEDTICGITLYNSSFTECTNNTLTNSYYYSIYSEGSSSTVFYCNNFNQASVGLYLRENCVDARIQQNTFTNCYGSIVLINVNDSLIQDNVITSDENYGTGIDVYLSYRNIIKNNYIAGHELGINGYEIYNNTFIENTLWYNSAYNLYFYYTQNNTLYHNNFFIQWAFTASDNGNNTWYNPELEEGNYWVLYDEPAEGAWDNDTNGIIDTPYHIFEGNNVDNYPLASPFDCTPPYIMQIRIDPPVQAPGGEITVNCTVIDNICVSQVYLNLTGPEGYPPENIQLYHVPNTDYYTTTLHLTYLGLYQCQIWAVDTSDNSALSLLQDITIQPPDYIQITQSPGGFPLQSTTIGTEFQLTGYASAYNNTYGYIGLVQVNWFVETSPSNAYTEPPEGTMSRFNSGTIPDYSATWIADDGYGNQAQVVFHIINSPIFVDDDAESGWYDETHVSSITEALSIVSFGQTITVNTGIYPENIVIDKPVKLVGENQTLTVIDGQQIIDVITIIANNVVVTNFSVTNSSQSWDFYSGFGIGLYTSHNTISRCLITKNNHGIVSSGSDNNITGNIIENQTRVGILIYSGSKNLIQENTFSNNSECAIYLEDTTQNILKNNHISIIDVYYIGYGIALNMNTYQNIIEANSITTLESEEGYSWGIGLWQASNNIITKNYIYNNSEGINLFGSCDNLITENTFINNSNCGIEIWYSWLETYSVRNRIYHNNFINNLISNVIITGIGHNNFWDDGYPSGGNYWDDHVCTGNPSDGSQPYTIDNENIDHYPYQDPNGWIS
ncbi:MAG: NosD domain-containing protein [Methanobacteriota archaeon]